MIVKPFRGYRPPGEFVSRVASLPYDVVSTDEARELAAGNPYSFLRVVRPEIDLPSGTDPHTDAVYSKGRENLSRLIERGSLVQDASPAFYVYRLTMGEQTQVGILGAAAVEDYLQHKIRRHEDTRTEKKKDRIRLNLELRANPGPVFLTYRSLPELNAVVNRIVADSPTVEFRADDDVRHEMWVVDDETVTTQIVELFGRIKCAYVADGHHRTAAAASVSTTLRRELTDPTGDEPCFYFMTALFPSDQLHVLDYNRVVRDLNGLDVEAYLARLAQAGLEIRADHDAKRPPAPRSFGMYLAGRWYLLTVPSADVPEHVVGRLDVSLLSTRILEPILGIGDPRSDERIDFVGGIRGVGELERLVDSGAFAVAFSMYPTSLDDVLAVADKGCIMPPKSTWFEPKLRSGLVVQSLEGERL